MILILSYKISFFTFTNSIVLKQRYLEMIASHVLNTFLKKITSAFSGPNYTLCSLPEQDLQLQMIWMTWKRFFFEDKNVVPSWMMSLDPFRCHFFSSNYLALPNSECHHRCHQLRSLKNWDDEIAHSSCVGCCTLERKKIVQNSFICLIFWRCCCMLGSHSVSSSSTA